MGSLQTWSEVFSSEKDNMKFVKTQFCEMYKDLCIVKCFVFNPQHLYQIKKKKKCFVKSSQENYKDYFDTRST